jgi:hypothetical protein
MKQKARRHRLGAARSLLVLCIALACVACRGTPALALTQRGHVLCGECSFGSEGTQGGQLNGPTAIAVNEASGDVYVLDAANNRVERFSASGQFLEAWGFGVANGANEYERCAEASRCKAGIAGHEPFELDSARAIAVDSSQSESDPSRGDVYVESGLKEDRAAIEKFSAEGVPLRVLKSVRFDKKTEPFEALNGLAMGEAGDLLVYDNGEVLTFSDSEPNKLIPYTSTKEGVEALGEGEPPGLGLAVDAQGDLYVGHQASGGSPQAPNVVRKLTGSGEALIEELNGEATAGVAAQPASAGDDPFAGDVYVANEKSVATFDSSGALVQRVGVEHIQDAGGVAADAATGRLYVTDIAADRVTVFVPEPEGVPTVDGQSALEVSAASARLDAQIDPDGAPTSASFRYAPGAVPGAGEPCAAPCVELPASPGELIGAFGDQAVSAQLGELRPGTRYRYRVLASNVAAGHEATAQGEGAFTTPAAGGEAIADGRLWEMVSPPDKSGAGAEPLTEAGGVIQAAANGMAFAYVTDGPVGEPEGNRSLEVTQMLSARGRDGWSSQDIVTPNQRGTGLELGTAGEYRLFSTSLALGLVQPFATGGSRFAEPPLSPPVTTAEEASGQEKTLYLRDDLPSGSGSSEMEAALALTPSTSEVPAYKQATLDDGYLALVTDANVLPGAQFGQALQFVAATPDLSHVVISSQVALTPDSAPGENLYEWGEGQLRLVNVLPGAERKPAAGAKLGYGGEVVRDAISDGGKRVFWSADRHLYMSEPERDEAEGTVQLDEYKRFGGSGEGIQHAVFQTASANGAVVFFTDEQRLTENSGAAVGRPDLYAYDVNSGTLTDLTPPSATGPYAGEGADVLGQVLGASEDGTWVYFVANGVLGAGENPRGEEPARGRCASAAQPNATCNLYVAHYESERGEWEGPRFVARLSGGDAPDWGAGYFAHRTFPASDLGEMTARVSPNGLYLAFMSDRSLTGYDNEDVTSGHLGERLDEEVFLYGAGSSSEPEGLLCASCDPSGGRPAGVFDPAGSEPVNPEGYGLVVDRPKVWQGRWLAGNVPGWTKLSDKRAIYQSRYLSDSGRLYFQSPADLVPAAVNAKEDVYEYEPAGVPHGMHRCTSESASFGEAAQGCLGLISSGTASSESAFLDASETGGESEGGETPDEGGGDVFFVTAAQLSPRDTDQSFDVYDAHECTSSSPCVYSPEQTPPAACAASSSCRPYTEPTQTPASGPATGTTGPSGNLSPQHGVLPNRVVKPKPATRAQKLAAALASCRTRYKRSTAKREACEKRAHRSYGPIGHKATAKGGRR